MDQQYHPWIIALVLFLTLHLHLTIEHWVNRPEVVTLAKLQWKIGLGEVDWLADIYRRDRVIRPHPKHAFLIALRENQFPSAQFLLAQFPSLAEKSLVNRRYPLHYAVEKGHLPLVQLLLRHGANPNYPYPRGETYRTADLAGKNPFSLLYISLFQKREDLARILIAAGAEINLALPSFEMNKGGYPFAATPLKLAVHQRMFRLARYMIDWRAQVAYSRRSFVGPDSILHWTARWGESSFLEQLKVDPDQINSWDFTGNTPLLLAANRKRLDLVRLFLGRNAAVDRRSESGHSPLDRAAEQGNLPLARLLLQHGASVNDQQGASGRRVALHYAAWRAHRDLVALLLDHGASPHRLDRWGRTPFELTLLRSDRQPLRGETALLLLEHQWSWFTVPWTRPDLAK